MCWVCSFLLLSRFKVDAGFVAFFDANVIVLAVHAVAVVTVVPWAGFGGDEVFALGAEGFGVHNSFFLLFSSPVTFVINAVNNNCSDY